MKVRTWKKCLILGLCIGLTGCSATLKQQVDEDVTIGVDIHVPYATAKRAEATATPNPLNISANGSVTLNDTSFLDAVQDDTKTETDGTYIRLENGSTGDEVRALQTRLKQLNYYTGDITGIFDDATEEGVRRFELTYGSMQTGIATIHMQNKLYETGAIVYGSTAYNEAVASRYKTMQKGDAGGEVQALQQRLIELGYPLQKVTGICDAETLDAVQAFCTRNNLECGNVVTVDIQKALYSMSAYRYLLSDSTDDIYTVSNGSAGNMVINLQTRLIQLGYLSEKVSGTFNDATEEAVREFQRALGLKQTGMANLELQQVVASAAAPTHRELDMIPSEQGYSPLQSGDTGDGVARLQERLIELEYAMGTPSRQYDRHTIRAVNLFRAKCGMAENGIASSEMQGLLYSEFAPKYTEDIPQKVLINPEALGQGTGEEALYRLLQVGSEGQDVLSLEMRLRELEYFTDTPDIYYDGLTMDAVNLFRQTLGLAATGEATGNLQYHLFSDSAPKSGVYLWNKEQSYHELFPGDVSDDVLNLQRKLWELGYLAESEIEGAFGVLNEATLQAVQSAQDAMGYLGRTRSVSEEFQAFLYCKYNTRIRK